MNSTVLMTRHLSPFVLAALVLCWPLHSLAALPPGSAAEILSLQGAGDQRGAGATDWQPARRAQALASGDFVRTREAAKMALLFSDDTQVRLNQNSVLQVKGVATPNQPVTTLFLGAGRAWAQTKRADGSRLNLETPAAVAAIRGTDWDIEVGSDGRTLLTVLSGSVAFSNAQGQVTVGANEAALAEVGKAPVKLQLSQPRDRIQWVNALSADVVPHLDAQPVPAALQALSQALRAGHTAQARQALESARSSAPAPWLALMDSAVRLREGDRAGAQTGLTQLVANEPAAPIAAWLLLSDLQRMDGDHAAASATLQAGLARWSADPALQAHLAQTQLLADKLEDSERTLSSAGGATHLGLTLVRAELARRRGDASATLAHYTEATRLAPQDSRGWFGLGSAHNEREDTGPARAALQRALALQAHAEGYQGELGTLETFVNRFAAADSALAAALSDNPSDYVAWSGLGLLRLKQGQPAAALDALLRAGVMEPRYARAKTWTAVAYYQLGRPQDAVSTLQQAITLDDKDPVPYMLLAQIHTDHFRAGEAVQAARAAVQRMPYLKSLNQLANDQKGSANLGASLAFFGMEDWALELAQQSFNPYWGASHLFLADRYPGEFNKNSALFQGFLTDPLAFGGSQRFASLLQQPGSHGAAGLTLDGDFYRMRAPSVTLNGMDNSRVPIAWFFKVQEAQAVQFPIDVSVTNYPAFRDATGNADLRARVATLGLGLQANERLNLFAYANHFDSALHGHNQLDLSLGSGQLVRSTQFDTTRQQGVLGLSYRWAPSEQTWLKLGRGLERNRIDSYPGVFVFSQQAGLLGLSGLPDKTLSDFQLRHSLDTQRGTRWSFALEHAREKQASVMGGVGPTVGLDANGQQQYGYLVFAAQNAIDRRYTAATLSLEQTLGQRNRLDAALTATQIRHNVDGHSMLASSSAAEPSDTRAARHDTEHILSPRLGLVLQPATGTSVRLAYQDWVRPLSTSTLTAVDTAGIAVEDRLLEAGGRHKRLAAQLGLELGASTFFNARLDRLRVHNPGTLGVDMRTPSLPFLEEMRNAQLVNLSSTDVLEDTPSFETGTLNNLALGVNHMLSTQWSTYGKYLYQHGDSSYEDDNQASGRVSGKAVPYIPLHTAVLGTTWASSQRLYLSGRVVYRSERFEDKENLTRRPPGWSLDLMGFWETRDKHWVVGVAAMNLFAPASTRQTARYVVDARYRF